MVSTITVTSVQNCDFTLFYFQIENWRLHFSVYIRDREVFLPERAHYNRDSRLVCRKYPINSTVQSTLQSIVQSIIYSTVQSTAYNTV